MRVSDPSVETDLPPMSPLAHSSHMARSPSVVTVIIRRVVTAVRHDGLEGDGGATSRRGYQHERKEQYLLHRFLLGRLRRLRWNVVRKWRRSRRQVVTHPPRELVESAIAALSDELHVAGDPIPPVIELPMIGGWLMREHVVADFRAERCDRLHRLLRCADVDIDVDVDTRR